MKVAISMMVSPQKKIDRKELIRDLQSKNHKVVYIGQESGETLNPDYKDYNVDFIPIKMGRSNTNPFNEIKSLLDAKKAIKKNNVEVLIAYGIRTFPLMVIAAKLAGVKKILCVVNGSGRLFKLNGIRGFLIKLTSYPMLWLAFLFSNSILFQNNDDMKMIKRKGLLAKKNYGTINGSGVNLNEFQFTPLEKKPVFLMISRITGSKGVNEYINAAIKVKKSYKEAIFYLIGPLDDESGINMPQLQKSVDNGIIHMLGKIEDIKPCISMCRIFVLPSYYPEGVPRSILEAMSMGRPIITTDSPGCKETVVDGINGFKVPPKNSDLLAEKMEWMIENPNKVEKMGRESRRLAEMNFDVSKVNDIMLKTLNI
ncbi:glycosyltransferase family 4 protein [Sutcliffiella horikoshii]|uniref:glycosyltransferase family 4 protein n=1 Tax=Sutcliffiella horikoshii TaxID=79883 RepID=UPI0038503E69